MLFAVLARLGAVMSVTQKNVPSEVVYYYCAWYVFLCDRRHWSLTKPHEEELNR